MPRPKWASSRSVWSRERYGSVIVTGTLPVSPANRSALFTCALATGLEYVRPRSLPPRIVRGRPSAISLRSAPICRSGWVTRRIGRRRSEAAPVSVAENFWPARMPSISRAVVPELPQCKRAACGVKRLPTTCIVAPSRIVEISAPSWRRTRAVLFTSSLVSKPLSSLFPRPRDASMATRCEMLLSPGGRTTPPTRRTLGAPDASPPGRRAAEPGREGRGIADLERTLDCSERLFQGAQRGQDFVAVHEQDFGPQRRLAGGQSRRIGGARPERRAGRRVPGEEIAEQRSDDLRQVTGRGELRVVAGGRGHHPPPPRHKPPKSGELARPVPAPRAPGHGHQPPPQQTRARRPRSTRASGVARFGRYTALAYYGAPCGRRRASPASSPRRSSPWRSWAS